MGEKESKKEKRERKKLKKETKKSKEEEEIEEQVEATEVTEATDFAEDDLDTTSDNQESHHKTKFEEITVELTAGTPLSKKQQRLLKKGKIDLEKLSKKHPAPKPLTEDGKEESESAPKRSPYGVWIGNLSYDTTKEDLERFITLKTSDFKDELVPVELSDISRVNLPKKNGKSKGFAYIDLPSVLHVQSVVKLSEEQLNGRKVLIKDSTSFEGRPETATGTPTTDAGKPLSKNPPSRILFVGNLSFDTTSDLLEEHFRHCGEIVKIRMATFEDSGKCKGFAFVDFKDVNGPTTALKSKLAKKLINRPLRLEYGEDRSKRTPNRPKVNDDEGNGDSSGSRDGGGFRAKERPSVTDNSHSQEDFTRPTPKPMIKKRKFEGYSNDSDKRVKSSIALATAQRASAAIVPSQGKKIKFD
ncbi:uncharacterized protein KQ657_000975 [Scheffersomyces spartinae]|uniref:RRM domain-containing protein n=1 Tax=Scheffersomyces spartinae TaxID=45513 RepID=A0A9P8AHW1_9ASCO|nr:uncharacterized protein KQ657_000975 [Scheffersomyces spartinae]KAG7193213.1 hypothetical protein KQ657_000975 [Scheffersomyces spartinae]